MSAVVEARELSAHYVDALQPPLVQHLYLLVDAPNGVARLRELVVALAVQGKLVPQNSSDEPAKALLARIHIERKALIAEGKVKRDKLPPPILSEDEPFPLPRGWEWVRFGDLIHELCTGPFGSLVHKEDYVGGGVPLINPSHMIDGYIKHDPDVSVTSSMAAQLEAYRLSAGDVLLARRGEVGRYALVTENEAGWLCGTGSFFVKLHSPYDRRYFGLSLEDPRLRRHLLGESVGSTMTNLNQRILLDAVVAAPPLAEQARIVSRVDELMRLCDAVEAKNRLETELHTRLLGTLLGTLTDSTTPEELTSNWQRVADHFDLLLDRPEAVDALEEVVIHLAVRGLLVPQDPAEEPAKSLRDRIDTMRARTLGASATRKMLIASSPVDSEEAPFSLPPGWEWTRFSDVAQVTGGVTLGRKRAVPSPVSLPYLRVANVQRWKLSLGTVKSITVDASELQRYQLAEGDLLITEGGDWDKVGRTAIWRSELAACLHQNHVFKARGYTTEWFPAWAELFLNSDVARTYFAASAKQTTNLASINMTELKHCVFPLPPLEEQKRIVARVNELCAACAELRRRLAACQTTQSHLVDSLIESALAS